MTEPAPGREPVEKLAGEFIDRLRRGESPTIEEYAARYPELAGEIRELFPTVAAMEDLKMRAERPPDGRASMGPLKLKRLGDFRIVRELGRGGMGVVYEAQQESLGRRVALKVLPHHAMLDRRYLMRFKREARIAARLHHTNIVQVYGVGESGGFHYYAMEFVHGVGIDVLIERLAGQEPEKPAAQRPREALLKAVAAEFDPGGEGPPSSSAYFRAVCRVGIQVAAALAYAHAHGMLHRDIKPGNILVDDRQVAWVMDFGLAHASDATVLTQPGELAGTLRYMPPERFDSRATPAGDVYSLGLTLHEMLTLEPAFTDTDRTALMRRIVAGEKPRPRHANPRVPHDLETIVLKATATEPARRYASADELGADLQRFLDGMPIAARRINALGRAWRWCRRNPAVAGLSGAVLLLAVLVAAVATRGYLLTRAALHKEALARASAEKAEQTVLDALDRLFDRLAPAGAPSSLDFGLDAGDAGSVEVYTPPALSREAVGLLEDMLPLYDRLAEESDRGGAIELRAADAHRRVGDIHQRLGHYDQALDAYRRALDAYEALARGSDEPPLAAVVAEVWNEIGRASLLAGDADAAVAAHVEALAVLAAAPDPDEPATAFERARTHYLLGTRPATQPPATGVPTLPTGRGPRRRGQGRARAALERRGLGDRPEQAELRDRKEHLDTAVDILNGLLASDPTRAPWRRLLGLCYREIARVLPAEDEDGFQKAVALAIEIERVLADEYPSVPEYRYDLAQTYATADPPGGEPTPEARARSEKRLRRALDLADELVSSYPTVPEYRALLARVCHDLARILSDGDQAADTVTLARRAAETQARLVEELPELTGHAMWLGVYRNGLARALLDSRQAPAARDVVEQTVKEMTALLDQHPEMWYLHGVLAESYRELAAVRFRLDRGERANDAVRQAESHLRAFAEHVAPGTPIRVILGARRRNLRRAAPGDDDSAARRAPAP